MKRIPWQKVAHALAELLCLDIEVPPVPPREPDQEYKPFLSRIT
jgi:hypothetical protein